MNKNKKIKYVKISDEDYAADTRPQKKTRSKSEEKAEKYHSARRHPVVNAISGFFSMAGTAILSMFLILIITLCIVATALCVYVMQFAESSFDVDLTDVELSYSSFIYAKDKNNEPVLLKQISSDESRVWVDIEDIPQHVLDAFVAVEDERFFEHDGVDWKRTLTVTVQALFSDGTAGGSTITQQLVRDITQDNETTFGRKLREIFRALSLENKYTKFDILESYLNRIGFGGTAYGIGSAAYHYFDKEVSELTIAEAAMLAGLVRSPTNYNPYVSPQQSKTRQEYALSHMYENGYITTQEYEDAVAEKVRFRLPVEGDWYGYIDERTQEKTPDESDLYYEDVPWDTILGEDVAFAYQWNGDYEVTQNWYMDAALNQIVTDLADLFDISYSAAWEKFCSGGYTAYLNMDIEMQDTLSKKFEDPYTCLSEYDTTLPSDSKALLQGAFVVMDYRGNVKAIAGGIGEKPGDNCFNRATQTVSAIGSTIKPIANYSLAIDMNLITYSTFMKDKCGRVFVGYGLEDEYEAKHEYDPEEGTINWPENYERNYGTGDYYPAWYAVQKSTNTIAARTMSKIGLANAFNHLVNKLGFSHLDSTNDMAYAPLATGALTNGATLVELTAAFQPIGNGGMYYKPYFYSKVVDTNGKVVLEQDTNGRRAIDEDSAWIANRMMKKVIDDPYGTGQYAKFGNVEVVGKTGTANDESNLLFAGLTPQYVACYRIAHDDNHRISRSGEAGYAGWRTLAKVWSDVMDEVVTDIETEQSFVPDSDVLVLSYCNETGLLATSTSKCPETTIGYYRQSNYPASCDSKHDGTYWAEHDEEEPPKFE